jgi:glycosyltransferase involved in cell wall biosynthesis
MLRDTERVRPTFSVIIPTYNRAGFVTSAIQSVLRQSVGDYELLVVDDGSTDETPQVLAQYGDKITVLSQANQGVSAARNRGIENASGRWIAFLDSDDEWDETYLAQQSEHIRSHSDAVAFISNAVNCHRGGVSRTHFGKVVLKEFGNQTFIRIERPFRLIMSHSHWFLQSLLVRRDVLLRSGLLDTRLTIAEDLDVVARLALEGAFGFNKQVLVRIYRRTEPINHLASTRGTMQACKCFESVFENLRRKRTLTVLERLAVAKASSANYREIGNVQLAQGDLREARVSYRRALTTYPCLRSVAKYVLSLLPFRFARMSLRIGASLANGREIIG